MDRVDLAYEYGKTRHQRWVHEWADGPFVTRITLGQLADGRWFAERLGRNAGPRDKQEGACVYAGPHGEHYARATVRRWMRTVGGEWAEA